VAKLSNFRGCNALKKKLFQDQDAELTLKLLKITPQMNGLQVKRTDSEFLKDYNSTARQKSSTSHIIISTEGSESVENSEPPSLEQACKQMGKDQSFMFAPSFNLTTHGQTSGSQVTCPSQKPFDSQVQLMQDSMIIRSTVISLDHGLTAATESSYIDDAPSQQCLTFEAPYGNQPAPAFAQSTNGLGPQVNFGSSSASQHSFDKSGSQFAVSQ